LHIFIAISFGVLESGIFEVEMLIEEVVEDGRSGIEMVIRVCSLS
jgi:hypothetical protein